MCEKLLNEIKEEEKSINEQICNKFFNYHYQSFLLKDLYENNQNKNDKILKNMKKISKTNAPKITNNNCAIESR